LIRAVAGILDRRAEPGDGDVATLRAALSVERAAVSVEQAGRLAVACTGGAPARRGDAIVVVDGVIDELPGYTEPGESALLDACRLGPRGVLPGLRGDFALLAWGGARGLLARDQMGGRAWVWHDDGVRLRFATEVHILLRMLPARPLPDHVAMAHWLAFSGMPGEHTLYDGVRRILAGHELELDPERPHAPTRWWRLEPAVPLTVDHDDAAALLRERLEVAVDRRVGDGRDTAIMLSGGLDSSGVAGVAAASLPEARRLRRGYSAVFPDHPSVDETELIGQLCDAFDLRSTVVSVRAGSVLHGALDYLERWALPPVSPNLFFWTPLLRQAAADGTRVLLDGEGGDEIFGLSPYLIADRLAHGRVRSAAGLVHRVPGAHAGVGAAVVRSWLRSYGLRGMAPPGLHALSRRLRDPRRYGPAWLRPETARAFVASADGAAFKRHGGPRWWGWLVENVTSGMGPSLAHDHFRRRAAMAGLLPRHPLVDVDVIELVLKLPPELAFDPRLSRPVFRSALAGIVPDAVRLRPSKSTFDAVFFQALSGPDLPLAAALLADPAARLGAYVDLPLMKQALLDPGPPSTRAALQTWALQVWRLMTAECWLRAQEDPALPRRVAEAAGLREPDLDVQMMSRERRTRPAPSLSRGDRI